MMTNKKVYDIIRMHYITLQYSFGYIAKQRVLQIQSAGLFAFDSKKSTAGKNPAVLLFFHFFAASDAALYKSSLQVLIISSNGLSSAQEK